MKSPNTNGRLDHTYTYSRRRQKSNSINSRLGRSIIVLCLSVCSITLHPARALRQPHRIRLKKWKASTLQLRGGGGHRYSNRNDLVEFNPDYVHYVPPPPPPSAGGNLDDHDAWLREQGVYSTPRKQNESLSSKIQGYMTNLYQTSPSLYWTTISCAAIFLLWQIPPLEKLLQRWFVSSRSNLIRTGGASLALSALSHASPYHLLANLVTLLHLGPNLRTNVMRPPLWPLMLGSAMASNAFFLAWRRYASCMGLSGVTMSLVAVLARAVPDRVFRVVVVVFPVTLPAEHILQILVVVSLLGSFSKGSRIAHLTHLGGLLYGVLYYELCVNPQRKWRLKSMNNWGKQRRRTFRIR
jgi:membrane associated rhomboid family serine protease